MEHIVIPTTEEDHRGDDDHDGNDDSLSKVGGEVRTIGDPEEILIADGIYNDVGTAVT